MNDFNIRESVNNGLSRLFEYLPQVIGALLILVVGYFVALALRSLTRRILKQLRFDRSLSQSPAGNMVSRVVESPTRFVSRIVFWLVMLGVISLAVSVLNVPTLNNFIGAIYSYLPHVIAALAIFLVASAVSTALVAFVRRVMGRSSFAKVLSAAVPSLVMSIAVFMILDQLMIAESIVQITYTALIGAVALGLALAFGLGGRDVAARLLEQAYSAGQENVDEVKNQTQRAARNTKREADRVREQM